MVLQIIDCPIHTGFSNTDVNDRMQLVHKNSYWLRLSQGSILN